MKYGAMRNIQLSLWPEEENAGTSSLAEELLGMAGKRLFIGKGITRPPTIFIANIFDEKGERIWFGDIDIQIDRLALLRLSARIGSVFILNGIDGMLPRYKLSPQEIRSHAAVIVEEGKISYSREFAERAETLIKKIKKQKEDADAYRYR